MASEYECLTCGQRCHGAGAARAHVVANHLPAGWTEEDLEGTVRRVDD